MNNKYSTTQLLTDKPSGTGDDSVTGRSYGGRKVGGLRTKGWYKKTYPDKPLVTIVTVVYNGEDYLEETIRSVLNQTYTNVEYVIIDGDSNDDTLDIIRKFDDGIDFWISEPDEGIYDAMNKGTYKATGEYIIFINSGDFLHHQNTLMKVSDFIKKEERPDIIYGKTKVIYDENYFKIQNPDGKFEFKYGLPVIHQSILIKTSIQKNYFFDTSYKIYSDFDTYCKLLKEGFNFTYFPDIISDFRFDGVSSKLSFQALKEKYLIGSKYISFHRLKFVRHLFSSLFRAILKKVTPYHLKRKIQISK